MHITLYDCSVLRFCVGVPSRVEKTRSANTPTVIIGHAADMSPFFAAFSFTVRYLTIWQYPTMASSNDLIPNNNNSVLEDVAIDFRQLMRQEKRRAREKQRPKASNDKKEDTGTRIKQEVSNHNTVNHEERNASLSNWPQDWLSDMSISAPFKPDYISSFPETVVYKKHFLDSSKTSQLSKWLQGLPETTTSTKDTCGTWNTLKYAKRRVCMMESPLPLPLQQLAALLVQLQIFPHLHKPNHVLINDYTQNQGILPHTDGPLYYPTTATLSIGSEVLLSFQKRLDSHEIGMVEHPVVLQVLLHDGSLLVFSQNAYTDYCHGIDNVHVEYASNVCLNAVEGTRVKRGNRISLTFRHKL